MCVGWYKSYMDQTIRYVKRQECKYYEWYVNDMRVLGEWSEYAMSIMSVIYLCYGCYMSDMCVIWGWYEYAMSDMSVIWMCYECYMGDMSVLWVYYDELY